VNCNFKKYKRWCTANLHELSVINNTSFQVKSIILAKLNSLKSWLTSNNSTNLNSVYYFGYI